MNGPDSFSQNYEFSVITTPADRRSSILLMALGNDIMGDDAVALHAARTLGAKYAGHITVLEAMIAGYSLLDLIDGYSHVLLLDAITTGSYPQGTIRELSVDEFESVHAGSPHYVGVPEVFALARRLEVPLPEDFRILTVEIEGNFILSEQLSPVVAAALPEFISRSEDIVDSWHPVNSVTV